MYLDRGYPSSVKGGTAIVGDVDERGEHGRRLADPETYRPPACRACGRKLHAHGTRERRPVGETPIEIRRYRCRGCGGVVQVLPAFLARHLWRTWRAIEEVTTRPPEAPSVVPARTRRRWRERLREPARPVLHVLSALRRPALSSVVARIGLDATRGELASAFPSVAGTLAALTILVNHVIPGLRVM